MEKGNVVALASQKTKFGGEIVVASSVFVSDFEIDAKMNNSSSLPYANFTIINNILDGKKEEIEVTDIATVRKAEIGDVFAIEGYVANGTENENTTFFDTIYVQDETAGITVFPFSQAGLKKGTKIRIVGYVYQYQGDKELQIVSYEILSNENLETVEPKELSIKDSMDYENYGGSLIKVTGRVSRVEQEKEIVTAVGFLYKHLEGNSDETVPVLRVRDCDEIMLVRANNEGDSGERTEVGSSSSDNTLGSGLANTIKESKVVLQTKELTDIVILIAQKE